MTDFSLATIAIVILVLAAAVGGAWWLMRRPVAVTPVQKARGPVDTVQGWEPQVTRVMTVPEQRMYDALCHALPGYLILAQVPMARFLKVPTRNSYAEWLRRVGQQCADFVVCDRHTKVFAVVELTSPKTMTDERLLKRQQRKTRVLKAAGIAFHEWPEAVMPSYADLRAAVLPASGDLPEPSAGAAGMAPLSPTSEPAGDPSDGDQTRDPPPSTWFDDLDSGSVPLSTGEASRTGRPAGSAR